MRAFILAIALVAAICNADANYDAMFVTYKQKFNRHYSSASEEAQRRAIFETNMRSAAELEKTNPHARFGMNEYTDVDAKEFKSTHHNADFSKVLKNRKPIEYTAVQASTGIDWRTKGAVTHVKNQLQCGGCWSFSTTGNIEGQWFLAGHKLVSLSEQELLSCDLTGGDQGCGGGLMDYAFEWLVSAKNGIIETAASYPFVSGSGTAPACNQQGRVNGAQITGHHDLPASESSIAAYCAANGPVSIGVDAASFQTYSGGVLSNCIDGQLDHAVLIVGFSDTSSPPYWIIKNSWGPSWGEQGYIRVEKGTGQCGLQKAASSSLVTKNGPPVPTGGPTPPSPPSPATPAPFNPPTPPTPPTPTGKNYTVEICSDNQCSQCQKYNFPQGDCIDESFNGDSFSATCYDLGFKLDVNTYVGSEKCSGTPSNQKIMADTCYENVDKKTYLKFKCPF